LTQTFPPPELVGDGVGDAVGAGAGEGWWLGSGLGDGPLGDDEDGLGVGAGGEPGDDRGGSGDFTGGSGAVVVGPEVLGSGPGMLGAGLLPPGGGGAGSWPGLGLSGSAVRGAAAAPGLCGCGPGMK
jgi:hypothetical protein